MPTTTHPVTAKQEAVRAARGKKAAAKKSTAEATAAKPKPAPTKRAPSRWRDTNGVDLVKGLSVEHDGKKIGTVAYRHTHEIEGKPVGMIGVALSGKGATAKVGGRTIKNRTYRADALTAIPG